MVGMYGDSFIKFFFCQADSPTKVILGGGIKLVISISNILHGLITRQFSLTDKTAGDIRYALKTKLWKFAPDMDKISQRINLCEVFNIPLPKPFSIRIK